MKNWGKALLGVLGLAVVIILIAVPTAIYLNADKGGPIKTYTLEDYFNNSINYKSYNMRWISDKEYLHKENGTVFLHNVETGQTSEFLSIDKFLWRHSYTASYSVYDVENSKFVSLSDIPQEVQYLVWAPAGNMLAYVWNYNVYLKKEATVPSIQVTTNGEKNLILNGIPDWVYEEEMFSSKEAMWWSPGGKFLAYAQFNDTNVQNIEYSWYGTAQYPETVAIPYPKAGATNPEVKLFVVSSANTSEVAEIVVPSLVGSSDHYLSSVTWVTDNRIAVQWLKRMQNHVVLQIYNFDGNNWNENEVRDLLNYNEISKTGWVGQFSPLPPFFTEDNSSFYQVMSDNQGYKHIHYVTKVSALEVMGAGVTSQPERQCLTCDMNVDRCQYNSGLFSHSASYYRLDCYGEILHSHIVCSTSSHAILEDNKVLQQMLADIELPTIQRDKIKVGEFDLWYQMTLPPRFDKSKKYPLLIDVYAGPCSQKVDYRFRLNWGTYLASTENIIVASIDGRGSGYQGDKLMHSIYKRLGTYEVEDQIEMTRRLINMGFVDKERVAIWGWSYGGYVTSMVLGAGSGVFTCGMAVAPVSKWEYYGVGVIINWYIFILQNSTVTSRAKNFKSVDYLLVHGTADDNVHFQQAAEISEALVEMQVDFEAMWYTDKDHGLEGSAHRHVYTHLSHFLLKCFSKAK
ncbi:dipeptidyl peptidase 4-like [Arapaima gigas]